MPLDTLRDNAAETGLVLRGAFHPASGDGVPALPSGKPVATLVLLGFVGQQGWSEFAGSAEARDGAPDPLDRWSRRIIGSLADRHGAVAFFPFGGPPFLPFGAWARRAEPVHPSPLGLLIHPDWGLWHSYRGALGFATRLELPEPDRRRSPCEGCDRPCLAACPVGAFAPGGYDVGRCTGHLQAPAGADCMAESCRARRACPIAPERRHGPGQAAFHMRAFRTSQSN